MDNTPWTNYGAPQRRRKRLRQDSQGPFSSSVDTNGQTGDTLMFENKDIMQTSGNPRRPPPRSTERQGNNWFHGCCGVSFAKVPVSLPPTLRAAAGGVLRGRGIISDSCQPSALFGIMFLLGVILRLQKSCCLYSEEQGRRGGGGGVGWRWVAGFAQTDLQKQKKKRK